LQVHAGPELLQHFPPLLLIVGGTEILMAENILLAQKAQVRTLYAIDSVENNQLKLCCVSECTNGAPT
jgi:hypothetical protein